MNIVVGELYMPGKPDRFPSDGFEGLSADDLFRVELDLYRQVEAGNNQPNVVSLLGKVSQARFLLDFRNGLEEVLSSQGQDKTGVTWRSPEDALQHTGKMVTVYRDGEVAMTGAVVAYSDLLGGGGVLEPHPERGMDYVTRALPFPSDERSFEDAMSGMIFVVHEPEDLAV